MKRLRDLSKKKKIRAMNDKTAINTYLQIIESKTKLSEKRNRQDHGYGEGLMPARREAGGGTGEEVRG